MPNRTPGPWLQGQVQPNTVLTSDRTREVAICLSCYHAESEQEIAADSARANAAFIVLACNAYDSHLARIAELEGALRDVGNRCDELAIVAQPTKELSHAANRIRDHARRALAGEE